jgi:5-methyltetrahydrofolate--homocysteine methyltransferase
MAQYAVFARDAGATVIGGCCGTTPEHVAAMVEALNSTSKGTFDAAAMDLALGVAWKNLPDPNAADSETSSRRGRRKRA